MGSIEIDLKPAPDSLGFTYGRATWKGISVRLDIIPPVPLFRADVSMPEYQPDPTHWRVFADGQEVGRIEATRETLMHALEQLLMHGQGYATCH